MSAFRTILRHEARGALVDRAVLAAVATFLALAAYALASGNAWAETRRAEAAVAEGQSAKRNGDLQRDLRLYETGQAATLDKPAWYPEWIKAPTTPDARITLPPAPLAALTPNAGELQPLVANMRLATSRYALFDDYSSSTQNPATLAVGRLDMAFVLIVVLPLLLIGVSYDVLSAERERGTLALLLTQPVRPGEVLAAKILARGAVVLAPALAITLAGAWLTRAPGAPPWFELAALGGLVLAYGSFWLVLAALVNAGRLSSATNAMALGGLWLALVLAVPSGLNLAASRFAPPPDRAALTNAMRATLVSAGRRGQDLFADFNVQHPERPVPRADGGGFETPQATLTLLLVRRQADAELAPLAAGFEARQAAQTRLADGLRLASPAMAMQAALARLSGVDRARTQAFTVAARSHLDTFTAALAPRLEAGRRLSAADYDRLPRFRMPPTAYGAGLAVDGLAIVAPALLVVALTWLALRRRRLGDQPC